MAKLSNSPTANSVLDLEQRKSFAFELVLVEPDGGRPVDLTGTTITFTLGRYVLPFTPPEVVFEQAAIISDPTIGAAVIALQADQLDLTAGSYPFTITMVQGGYSLVLVKGDVRLQQNPEQASAAVVYAPGDPVQGWLVELAGRNVIRVTTTSGVPLGLQVPGDVPAGESPVSDGDGGWSWGSPDAKAPESIPAAADLNTYTKTGTYVQLSNGNINPGGGLNYPGTNAGLLEVFTLSTMVWQRYTEFQGPGTATFRKVWMRGFYNTAWTEWREMAFSDSRFDMYARTLRLFSTTDASETSTGHAIQIGETSGLHMVIDNNEIGVRVSGGGAWGDPVSFPSGIWGLPMPATVSSAANKKYVDDQVATIAPLSVVEIPAGTDLNTMITTGFYRQALNANASQALNYPGRGNKAGLLEVFRIPASNMCWQRYTEYGSLAANVYTRGQYGTTWSPWTRITTATDDGNLRAASWPGKAIVAHRGGAAVYPEHSMEAYRHAGESGFIIEADVRRLSDGTLVSCHDASTSRTMTGAAANVSALTEPQWREREILSAWPGGKNGTPCVWEELLDEWGGRRVIMVELKDTAAQLALINSIQARQLEKWVIVQSFTLSVCQAFTAEGIPALYLCGSTTSVTPAELVASKIGYLGPSSGMTAAAIAPFRTAGIKVMPYTVSSPADWSALLAKNVDGAFFDDPWGATNRFPKSTSDPFAKGEPFPGAAYWENITDTVGGYRASWWINYLGPSGGLFMQGRAVEMAGSNATIIMRQGWATPVTPSTSADAMTGTALRFRGVLEFDEGGGTTNGSATRWAGVFIGVTPDRQAFQDQPVVGQYGYHLLIRRNGDLALYRVDSNAAAVLLMTQTSTPIADVRKNLKVPIELVINGPGIRASRLDTGVSLGSVTDTTHRGVPFDLHLSINGSNAQWREISYVGLPAGSIGY